MLLLLLKHTTKVLEKLDPKMITSFIPQDNLDIIIDIVTSEYDFV